MATTKTKASEPAPTTATPEPLCVSFVCIGHKDDVSFFPQMLSTLPKGCEVIVLWNEQTDEQQGEHRYSEPVLTKESHILDMTIKQYEMVFERGAFDFSTARNIAARFASREWIMWMDMDNRLLTHQHSFFRDSLPTYPIGVGGLICGEVGCQPVVTDGGEFVRYHEQQLRLYRNGMGLEFRGLVHEQVAPSIAEASLRMVDCSLVVHHIGFDTDADTLAQKAKRNAWLEMQEILKGSDSEHFYGKLLHRDLGILLSIQQDKGIS